MSIYTVGTKNLILSIATFVSGFFAHLTASDFLTYTGIGVGLLTAGSYIQKIYYNWELRRHRKRKQNNNLNP